MYMHMYVYVYVCVCVLLLLLVDLFITLHFFKSQGGGLRKTIQFFFSKGS